MQDCPLMALSSLNINHSQLQLLAQIVSELIRQAMRAARSTNTRAQRVLQQQNTPFPWDRRPLIDVPQLHQDSLLSEGQMPNVSYTSLLSMVQKLPEIHNQLPQIHNLIPPSNRNHPLSQPRRIRYSNQPICRMKII